MPQVIAAAVAYFVPAAGYTAVGYIGVGAVSYATIIGYAVTIAASVAYSSSQNAKLRSALSTASLDNGRSVMIRDPLAPRRLIYGTAKVSGTIVFLHTTGSKNEYLHLVVVLAGHEVDAITDIYFNDELVELTGNIPTGKYAAAARINKKRGVPGDTADADLIAETGGKWTSNHKLSGCAYLAVRLKWSPELFPNGLPTISAIVRGKKCYDPRTTTTVWTDNPALCIGDYLRDSTFGKGIALARIRDADWIEAANICDEAVGIVTSVTRTCDMVSGNRHIGCATMTDIVPGYKVSGTGVPAGSVIVSVASNFFTIDRDPTATNAAASLTIGDTEPRYTCNGIITADQDPAAVLQDLAGAMAGHIVDTGGTWTIRAGAWRTPALTLTDADLCGGFSVQPRQSRQDTFNGVKGVFISPANDWAPADFPAIKNDTYKTQDGEVRLWLDVQYNFTTSSAMAQRLAKIELERGRQQITASGNYMLRAMQCMPGDVIAITRTRLGWTTKYFEVIDWTFSPQGDASAPSLAVALNVRETAEGVWDWNDGEETLIDLAPNTDLPDPFTVPTPSATYLSDSTTVIIQPDGTVMPRIKVSWTTPNNIYVEAGGFVEIEFKLTSDSTWLTWSAVQGNVLEDYISADLKVGLTYNVRVRFRNTAGVRGAYHTSGSITAVGDNTTPNAPTGLTVTALPGYILVDWDPSTSVTVNEYFVYRSTTSSSTGFSLIGQTAASQFSDGAVTPGVTYWYRVVGESISGFPSAILGPSGPVVASAPSGSGTIPSNPTAATSAGSSGTYSSSDGGVMSFFTLSVPAMPANAVWQNVLYRRVGGSEWTVGAQLGNTGSVNYRIDDLTPSFSYDMATQAWSGAGASSIIAATGSPFGAPSKTSAPGAPTSGSLNPETSAPAVNTSLTGILWGSRAKWSPPADKDIAYYEIKATGTNSDGATDYAWWDGVATPALYRLPFGEDHFSFYNLLLNPGFVRVRAVDNSGNASAWLSIGNANGSATQALQDMAMQRSSDVRTSGITIGGSGVNKLTQLVPYFGGHFISGGGLTDTMNVPIGSFGFFGAPDIGVFQTPSLTALIRYDWDDSTSTNAVFRVRSVDGANLPSGLVIITGFFASY